MCDALLKLKPENVDVEIDTKIRYASAITKKENSIDEIKMVNNHFQVLNEMSKRLKKSENVKNVLLEGYIKSLDRDKADY